MTHEARSGALLVDKERGIRIMADQKVASGDWTGITQREIDGARKEVSGFDLKSVIGMINASDESEWESHPALYIALIEQIEQYRQHQEAE